MVCMLFHSFHQTEYGFNFNLKFNKFNVIYDMETIVYKHVSRI